MSDLITGQLPIKIKINPVNNLTQKICFNNLTINNCTQNEISKIAKTEFLLQSLANYGMNPKSIQSNI